MSTLAVNDAGDVLAFDGREWKPAQVAENDRGERMAFDGKSWQRIGPPPSIGARAMDAAQTVAMGAGNAIETAGNYRDTQFAKAMGGVAGIPRMMGDAVQWAGNKIGVNPGSIPLVGPAATVANNMPTGEQASQFMLDRAKARPGFKEANINPVVDAGVQALFAGPVMGAGGKMGPLVNAGAAMGGEVAGDIPGIQGTQVEPYARVAGSIVGGVTPYALKKGGQAAVSLVEPFTAGGRDRIAGGALVKSASDPKAAIANMESYSPPVPGFQLPAGKASRDPGLMAAQEVAESKVPAMRGIYNENNAVLTKTLDDTTAGLPPASTAGETIQAGMRRRFDDLVKARKEGSDPLYEAARKSPDPVKPFPLLAYTADQIAANKGEPATVMQKARSLLFTSDKNGRTIPDRSAGGMMATREALGDMLSNQELGNHSRSLLVEMKKKVDEALDAVPKARVANAKFSELSRPLDPFNADLGNKAVAKAIEKDKFGKDFLMSAEAVPAQFLKGGNLSAPMMQKFMMANGGNAEGIAAMRAYVLDNFKTSALSRVAEDATGNGRMVANGAAKWLENNRGAAANVLTPDQVKALETITRALKEQSASIPGRAGSPTFDRLATESILGAFLSPGVSESAVLYPIKKALGVAYGGANEAAMNRLFEVMRDPKAAAALMKKANAGNVQMAEPVLARIAAGTAVSQVVGRPE